MNVLTFTFAEERELLKNSSTSGNTNDNFGRRWTDIVKWPPSLFHYFPGSVDPVRLDTPPHPPQTHLPTTLSTKTSSSRADSNLVFVRLASQWQTCKSKIQRTIWKIRFACANSNLGLLHSTIQGRHTVRVPSPRLRWIYIILLLKK